MGATFGVKPPEEKVMLSNKYLFFLQFLNMDYYLSLKCDLVLISELFLLMFRSVFCSGNCSVEKRTSWCVSISAVHCIIICAS